MDLGELTLKTSSILSQPVPRSQQALLVEAVNLCFSGGWVWGAGGCGEGWGGEGCAAWVRGGMDQQPLCRVVVLVPLLGGGAQLCLGCTELARPTIPIGVARVCAGVGCTVVQSGKRGANLFQNAESGWQLRWRRPLQAELRGEEPMVCSCCQLGLLPGAARVEPRRREKDCGACWTAGTALWTALHLAFSHCHPCTPPHTTPFCPAV